MLSNQASTRRRSRRSFQVEFLPTHAPHHHVIAPRICDASPSADAASGAPRSRPLHPHPHVQPLLAHAGRGGVVGHCVGVHLRPARSAAFLSRLCENSFSFSFLGSLFFSLVVTQRSVLPGGVAGEGGTCPGFRLLGTLPRLRYAARYALRFAVLCSSLSYALPPATPSADIRFCYQALHCRAWYPWPTSTSSLR